MKKGISWPAIVALLAAGLFVLSSSGNSFAASQASKNGVSYSINGQYLGIGEWSQNQSESFSTLAGMPTSNTYQAFIQRLRLNSSISYDELAHGMPLAAVFIQADLTNAYNGITDGYGTNGYYMLGGNPAPTGFNNDFNTFGLRQAYIRVITPIGAVMFGRMPVKFGLGVAVNTNADGLGDFLPLGNIGVFLGTLFGSEVSAYATSPCGTSTGYTGSNTTPSTDCVLTGNTEGYYPPAATGYTHIQMGTIPTIEVMTMKPVNHTSYSGWLTEAHLNQFEAGLSSANTAYTGTTISYNLNTSVGSLQPTANITFGGLSAKYSNQGVNLGVEFDYFRGRITASSQSINLYNPQSVASNPNNYVNGYFEYPFNATNGSITDLAFLYLPVTPSGNNQYDDINSYDLYLTASKLLDTSTPVRIGAKFGMGAPVADGDYNFTYYSTIQNTRTLFGDVIGSSWQPIQFSSPGISYIYGGAAGEAVGPNLANKWVLMVDAKEYLPYHNTLQESVIHASWLKTTINNAALGGEYPLFGGSNIGTEFDLNFTHHFTKTLAWEAWGSYVATGSGVDSFNNPSATYCENTVGDITKGISPCMAPASDPLSQSTHNNIEALGTDIEWNF